MARKRLHKTNRNKPVSVSLSPKHIDFGERNNINMSKIIQIFLDDMIELEKDILKIQKGVNHEKKKIK